ncbi:MAG: class I SAM-dependent methyltransferase [Thermomicrobiales bacterium]
MNHADHVRLIAGGIDTQGGVWADMGSGDGAFTLALRDIAGPAVRIYAIDVNQGVLRGLIDQVDRIFPDTSLIVQAGDMTGSLDLPPLDGIIAANSLHFVESRKQTGVLREWRSLLKPDGRVILVEYDAEKGNRWVPHPFTFRTLQRMAANAGYEPPKQIGFRDSGFLGGIYAALLRPVQRPLEPRPR